MLLSATAAFITTTPPLVDILNYNKRGTYLCLLISFALSLGTLIVGSAIMFVVSKCDRKWFLEVRSGPRNPDARLIHDGHNVNSDSYGFAIAHRVHDVPHRVSFPLDGCLNIDGSNRCVPHPYV